MVFFAPFIGAAAIYAGFASAAPMPDSAVGDEVAVSAPNGIPLSATPQQLYGSATDTGSYSQPTDSSYNSGDSYGSSGGSSYSSSNYQPPQEQQQYQPSYTSSSWSSATSSAASTYSSPSYGSGSSNWGGSGYDSCVQQCVASYGAPPSTYTPSSTGGSSGSYGSGATHTVIVAPSQGVLRYVPFALNASVGDTVLFQWGANNHTVTKSSELSPCNKTSDAPFGSGEQNKGFTFTQVINDTNPVFFYCGTPDHCEKGMFGIVNPPSAPGGSSSVAAMMSSMTANDSAMAAMWSYTDMQTSNNTAAANWGGNIDLSQMPDWSHTLIAQNVMYTRTLIAANPETLNANSSIDLGSAGSTPLMIPQDITSAVNNAGSTTSAASSAGTPAAATTAAASTTASSSASPASGLKSNGAGFLTSPRALVAVMVVVVTFFSL